MMLAHEHDRVKGIGPSIQSTTAEETTLQEEDDQIQLETDAA